MHVFGPFTVTTGPFQSIAGVRTSDGPRFVTTVGYDMGFDSLLTSNLVVEGSRLYRDWLQDAETFRSGDGDGARATLDMFPLIELVGPLNHYRGTQFRPRVRLNGYAISEITAHQIQPIFYDDGEVDQLNGLHIKAVQNEGGTRTIRYGTAIKIDRLIGWGDSPTAISVDDKCYFGADVQMGVDADIHGGRAVKVSDGLYIGGEKVVGAQSPAPPADATDLASAIALVNALKSIVRNHGLAA